MAGRLVEGRSLDLDFPVVTATSRRLTGADFGYTAASRVWEGLYDDAVHATKTSGTYFGYSRAALAENTNPGEFAHVGTLSTLPAGIETGLASIGASHRARISTGIKANQFIVTRARAARFRIADFDSTLSTTDEAVLQREFDNWFVNLGRTLGINPVLLKQTFVTALGLSFDVDFASHSARYDNHRVSLLLRNSLGSLWGVEEARVPYNINAKYHPNLYASTVVGAGRRTNSKRRKKGRKRKSRRYDDDYD